MRAALLSLAEEPYNLQSVFKAVLPMKQDSASPEFWENLYRSDVTPWDAGGVPLRLAHFLAEEAAPLKVLIPACGSGYEIQAFAEAGHDVTAIDFSWAAVERARTRLGQQYERIKFGDFFSADLPGGAFDLVYERTFLCALPRRLWPDYGPRVADLLRPGGRLAGFFFFDDKERGPPYGLNPGELAPLLNPYFELKLDEPIAADQSVAVLAGKERWQVWGKKS